ncbi:MAG: rRNA maturation RNase YbeY [Thermaerobacterales bacterium]
MTARAGNGGGHAAGGRVAVEFSRRPDAPPLPDGLESLLRRAVRATVAACAPPGRWQVAVTIAGDGSLADINGRFRGRPVTTDVLSFPMLDTGDLAALRRGDKVMGLDVPADIEMPLGDVILNLVEAERAGDRYGHGLKREACFLAVHGTLHLLGYDHDRPAAEQEMESLTEQMLAPLGLAR